MLYYIDYIVMTQSSDVAEATHDTTRHESAGMYMLVVLVMSSCCVIE